MLAILIAFGLAGWYLFTGIFDAIFKHDDQCTKNTYIDRSIHHHYHDNRSITFNSDETARTVQKKGTTSHIEE